MKRFDPAGLIDALREDARDVPPGWIRTIDVAPLLSLNTIAGVRVPIARIVRAGFAEERRIKHNRLIYRLSPRFKTWALAHQAALALEAFKTPAGWVTLTQYARKNKRTVRGIQYRIDGADIARKVFRTPRPVPHYRKADLDRLLRKAS
jgi:hypothetical protein